MLITVKADGAELTALAQTLSARGVEARLAKVGRAFLRNVDEEFSLSQDPYDTPWVRSKKPEGKTLIQTTTLRRSFNMEVSGYTLRVGVGGPASLYAASHQYGVAPYVIKPIKAKALRFVNAAGKVVFSKSINHPGLPRRLMLPEEDYGGLPIKWSVQIEKIFSE